jgi:hypothetical protein
VLHGKPQAAIAGQASTPEDPSTLVETIRLPETAGEVTPLLVLLLLTIIMGLTILAPLARLIQLSVEILLPY